MHKRSGVPRKPVVSPAEPYRGKVLSRVLPASRRKDGTWLTAKQRFCRKCGPFASALYESRTTCGLQSKPSPRPLAARDGKCVALRAAILSGIPNVRIALFRRCPVSARDILLAAHGRRAREIPLARENIPDSTLHRASSAPPPGPDVISNFSL